MKKLYYILFSLISLNLFVANSFGQSLTNVVPDTASVGLTSCTMLITGTGMSLPPNYTFMHVYLITATDTIFTAYAYPIASNRLWANFDFSEAVPGFYSIQFTNALGQLVNFPTAFQVSSNVTIPAPTLLFPSNGQVLTQCLNQLDWNDISGVSAYNFVYDTARNFPRTNAFYFYYPSYTQSNSGVISTFLGMNYWRVRGKVGNYVGPWSVIDSFTVSATAQLTSITPDNGYQGQYLTPILSGVNTHFGIGSNTMSLTLDQGSYSIDPIYRNDSYEDTVYYSAGFMIPYTAPTGLYDVNYYNIFDDSLKLYNGFYVHGGNIFSGTVYLDRNSNQVFDAGDLPYPQAGLSAPPANAWCQTNGTYSGYLPQGTFTIDVNNLPNYFSAVPPSRTITFSSTGTTQSGLDFAITPTPGVHDMQMRPYINHHHPRPGFLISVSLDYYNFGPIDESGRMYFIPPPNLNIVSVSNANYTMSGDTMSWNYYSLSPFQTGTVVVTFMVPATLPLGTTVHYEMGVIGSGTDITPFDNYRTIDQTVSNSFDPNTKSVDPENLSAIQVPLGQFLDYSIHFQNTGTDTAYVIRILDTISTNLDLSTIEVVGASHNYRTILYPNRVVEFHFDAINLPDSGTDQEMSTGFITYRIKADTNLTVADHILNTAYIYFDLNAPVVTNTAITTVGVGVDELSENNSGITVSPNPFNEKSEITYTLSTESAISLKILNYQGQLIRTLYNGKQTSGQYTLSFDASELPAGIYFVSLKDGSRLRVKKMVVIK